MLAESFAIIVAPGEHLWTDDGFDPQLLAEIREAVAELEDAGETHSEEEASVGRSASGIALLLTFAAIFLSGKRIEENLDSWVRLAKRLNAVLLKLRRIGRFFISEPAAAVLAFKAVVEREGAAGIVLQRSSVIRVRPEQIPTNAGSDFALAPERYYLFEFVAGSGKTHLVCLRSTGEVEFHHVLRTAGEMQFFGFGADDLSL